MKKVMMGIITGCIVAICVLAGVAASSMNQSKLAKTVTYDWEVSEWVDVGEE